MPIHPHPRRVLCVAEKPSIAKEIARILGEGQANMTPAAGTKYIKNYTFPYKLPPHPQAVQFTVTAVLGHVNDRDFGDQHRKWHSCEPFALFDAEIYESLSKDNKPVVTNIKRLARDHDLLLIWTDCDREGEHIGAEVLGHCRQANPRINCLRAKFSAIIPAQIHNAARNPVALDMLSAAAVDLRIELDLRTGAAITRLQTMNLQSMFPELDSKVISYGPCQFPTLGFVVARYLHIQAFAPEDFWFIAAQQERDENIIEFNWRRNHLFDFEAAVVLYEQCVERPLATVTKVETKPSKKWKPLPLTTVEMQKSGSRLLHMSPKAILDAAEKLYQKGFLSYPRTETDQYDKDFDFKPLIEKQIQDNNWGGFAQGLQNGGFQIPRNGKKNDKAHPPIHPTAWTNPGPGDEKKVYEFVTRRFLASCSQDAQGKTTTVEIEIAEEEFHTSGLVVLERNYLDVYPYDRWNGTLIPDFVVDETFVPSVCELKSGSTTAPSLLTEADLVGIMDQNGIGTDATIAEHIATVVKREYVMEQQQGNTKYLTPSTLGIALVEGWDLIGFDRSLCKPHLRRETEHRMQLICDGLSLKRDVMEESLTQYKEVFIKAKREWDKIVQSVTKYLRAPPGEDDDDGGGGRGVERNNNNDEDDDDDDDDYGGGGRGARGRGAQGARGRGAAAPRARGRGRGAAAPRARGAAAGRGAAARGRGRGAAAPARGRPVVDSDEDEFDEDDGPPPPSRGRVPNNNNNNNGEGGGGGGGGGGPQCQCNKPAVERTVTRETPNKDRKFWCCSNPQDESCGFFEWCDGPSGGGGGGGAAKRPFDGAQNRRPPPQRRAKADDDDHDGWGGGGGGGTLKCGCNLTSVVRTVGKDGPNKGRQFWTCPNSEGARCIFFKWDDEIEGGGGGGGGVGGASGGSRGGGGGGSRGGGGGGGGGNDECFKCHQTGHWSNACPNEGDGGGGGPSRSRSGGGTSGSGGGRDGGGGGGGGGNDECFKCHETGHWSNACPNEGNGGGGGPSRSRGGDRGGGGGGGGGSNDECYKCHETGHWSSNCPNEGSNSRGGGSSSRGSRGARGRGRGGSSRGGGGGSSRY